MPSRFFNFVVNVNFHKILDILMHRICRLKFGLIPGFEGNGYSLNNILKIIYKQKFQKIGHM